MPSPSSLKKVLLTGGSGFLGRHVRRAMESAGASIRLGDCGRAGNDLRDWGTCGRVTNGIDTVVHLAAHVGGIGLNQAKPGELFYDNAMMGIQLMEAARQNGVTKFVSIGTVCEYPRDTPAPFREADLWNGYPEATNAPYGLAKKMLLVQGQAYRKQYGFNAIHLLLVNCYGPGDNFDPKSSHVIPALIRKCLEAQAQGKDEILIWGSGRATREFIYVEDAAAAIVLATEHYNGAEPVNIGSGSEIAISDLVAIIAWLTGFEGWIVWDPHKPDGQPRRLLDTSRAQKEFGFSAQMPLFEGLRRTVEWYRETSALKATDVSGTMDAGYRKDRQWPHRSVI